jgi:hypothetical protein
MAAKGTGLQLPTKVGKKDTGFAAAYRETTGAVANIFGTIGVGAKALNSLALNAEMAAAESNIEASKSLMKALDNEGAKALVEAQEVMEYLRALRQ